MGSYKKIAIVGAHGVGKSTLCQALHEYAQSLGKTSELVGEVVRRCPLKIHDQQTIETTYWITCSQIIAELEAQNKEPDYIFCDRSVYDPIMYHQHWYPGLYSGTDEIFEMADVFARSYDRIYLIIPAKKKIEPDGFRSTDKAFQDSVHKIFCDCLAGRCGWIESDEIFRSPKKLAKRILELTC